MEKATAFLEKNVEWFALALGGLFLAYVAWAYFINPPRTVEIGNEKVTPGSVDQRIAEGSARQLEQRVQNNPEVPMPTVDVVQPWIAAMRPENPPAIALVPINPNPPRTELGKGPGPGIQAPPTLDKVKGLPDVPVIIDAKTRKGRSFVAFLQEKPKPPAARPLNPNDPEPPPVHQPVMIPVINQEPGGKFVLPEGWASADRYWVVHGGKFPYKEIIEEFKKARIPDYLHQDVAVMVEMERIEVDPVTGNPLAGAKPEKVKFIPMNAPPHDPWKETDAFLNWILQGQQAQAQMLQPPFHPFLAGDMWAPPMAPDPVDPNINNNQLQQKRKGEDFIDPTTKVFDHEQAYMYWKNLPTVKDKNEFWDTVPAKERGKLTQMRQDEEREEARQRAQQNNQNNNNRSPRGGQGNQGPNRGGGWVPPGAPRGGQPRPGRENQAQDNRLLGEMLASGRSSGTPYPRGGGPRRGGWEQPWVPPGAPGREGGEGAWQPPGQQWQGGNLGLDEKGRMDVWAIDENAEPGKSYKYRVRVLIKNPLYGMTNVAEDPKLEKIPYLPADPEKNWTPWSEKVTVPSNLDIQFVDQGALPNTRVATVGVNIKRWQNGKDNKTSAPEKVQAGDMIGKKQGDVDYTTGYTIVDIRRVGGDVRVRIMDKDGNIIVRSVNADRANPAFKDAPKPPPNPNEAIGQGPNPRGQPIPR